jgi:YHS domain-containing protein
MGEKLMSNFVWCHGPSCHKSHTQDRIRGVKGSKVLRTKKVPVTEYHRNTMYSYFCSQGCYNDFANTYVREVIAIAPRTEALETPINVTKEQTTGWSGHTYMETKITTVDNNGG